MGWCFALGLNCMHILSFPQCQRRCEDLCLDFVTQTNSFTLRPEQWCDAFQIDAPDWCGKAVYLVRPEGVCQRRHAHRGRLFALSWLSFPVKEVLSSTPLCQGSVVNYCLFRIRRKQKTENSVLILSKEANTQVGNDWLGQAKLLMPCSACFI